MTLDELIAAIDPEKTLDVMDERLDEALRTFDYPGGSVPDYKAFKDCIARFYWHVDSILLGLYDRLPKDMERHRGQATRMLMKAWGPDGDKAAANMAIYGVEGGLRRVLQTIAEELAKEYKENRVSGTVHDFLDGLSIDEKIAAAHEYVQKYGHLLPRDVTRDGAPRVVGFFRKFLKEHPHIVKRLRDTNRKAALKHTAPPRR